MINYISLISLMLFLASCSVRDDAHEQVERTKGETQVPVPIFDAESAFSYVRHQVEFGPRNPGSIGHQKCLQFLTFEMQKYADAISQQSFNHTGYDGRSYRLTNVIGSFNLQATDRILLGAHWDTRPRAERDPDPLKRDLPILGANDGASGVAVLLELARVLSKFPSPVGVDIILFDGEDYGMEGDLDQYCIGAKYFTRNMPPGFRPRFGIIIDMVGDKEMRLPRESNSMQFAPGVVNLIWNKASQLQIRQFEDRTGAPIYDDHIPLNEAGIPTALIIDLELIGYDGPDERRRYWHTSNDTPDQISPASLAAVGTVLTHIIYRTNI
jgi:glutaminyl-peptide cyclotransferase